MKSLDNHDFHYIALLLLGMADIFFSLRKFDKRSEELLSMELRQK